MSRRWRPHCFAAGSDNRVLERCASWFSPHTDNAYVAGSHVGAVVLAAIYTLVFGVLIPLGLLYLLWKPPSSLGQKLTFLKTVYKDENSLWELVSSCCLCGCQSRVAGDSGAQTRVRACGSCCSYQSCHSEPAARVGSLFLSLGSRSAQALR